MPNDDNHASDASEPTRKRGRRPAGSRNATYAANLKRLRARAGVTQEQLNDELDLATGTVRKWEQRLHDPSLDELKDVAAYFDVSTDELLNPTATFAARHRFVFELHAEYPSRVQIKEINFWAGDQTANFQPTVASEAKHD